MDKRKNNGGARNGAGRPKKADEAKLIEKLDNLISENKKFYNYKILYRPHPWQQKNRKILSERNYKNLVIDPQLKKIIYHKTFQKYFNQILIIIHH